MSRGERYTYPLCEEDDCYCKRHWPDRGGRGYEHSVIDNDNNGPNTVRCDTALHSNSDITTCSFCEKYMLGAGMWLHGKFNICARCQDKVFFIDAFTKVVDTSCKYAILFPKDAAEQPDKT